MENPWLRLVKISNQENLILDEEKEFISEFNSYVKNIEPYRIHTEIFPAPFMGDLKNAKIVILTLNPGYDKEEEVSEFYTNFKDWWLDEIQHKKPNKYHLFCLDEEYKKCSDYWARKLKPLIDISSTEIVSNKMCKIQFFPYHSNKYRKPTKSLLKKHFNKNYLPSQEYNFFLVKEAIKRKATIIIPRSRKLWEEAIPELKNYSNKMYTNSYQNITLSEKNLGSENFRKIKKILNEK